MKINYSWVQSYFKDGVLGSAEEVAQLLNIHSFEIESVDEVNGETVIDADILPNRSHDCLSHRGIAREIAVLLSEKTTEFSIEPGFSDSDLGLDIQVEDTDFCTRFCGVKLQGVKVDESPEWLTNRLGSIGQKSINNIVDITNYVMFDIGKPMHAFDADKVVGALHVRSARTGEKITTLDNKEVELDESIHIIADDEGPLAIAGVKGGKKAEVTKATKNVIIESAIFNSSTIRKTSRDIGIKTDSSKRFENGIANSLARDGLIQTVAHIVDNNIDGDIEVGKMIDVYPRPDVKEKVSFTLEKLNSVLGLSVPESEVASILDRFGFTYTKNGTEYEVLIPDERLDLRIEEDLIEEIGRVYGYQNIKSKPIGDLGIERKSEKEFTVSERIKNVLVAQGFSEIQTYVFGEEGDIEVLKPAASDKSKVRKELRKNFESVLEVNARNADLLGLSDIKIFEIGNVLTKEGEHLRLGLGVKNVKKDKIKEEEKIKVAFEAIEKELGVLINDSLEGNIVEIDLEHIVEKAETLTENMLQEVISYADDTISVKPVSPYPFMLRDVAVWTPEGVEEDKVSSIIEDVSGELLVRLKLFDVYKKDERTSYAFNLVFQSQEKTLTDPEVNEIMEKVSKEFAAQGWEVR